VPPSNYGERSPPIRSWSFRISSLYETCRPPLETRRHRAACLGVRPTDRCRVDPEPVLTERVEVPFYLSVSRGHHSSQGHHRQALGTYAQNTQDGVLRRVYVTHTLGSDASNWIEPFIPSLEGTTVSIDDISGIVAFGSKIGLMWGNRYDESGKSSYYFATHTEGEPDGACTARWRAAPFLRVGVGSADFSGLAVGRAALRRSPQERRRLRALREPLLGGALLCGNRVHRPGLHRRVPFPCNLLVSGVLAVGFRPDLEASPHAPTRADRPKAWETAHSSKRGGDWTLSGTGHRRSR
jgi:hypothetical protein